MTDWSNTKRRHGTESGYEFHGQLGELPCDPCYRAKAAANKRRREASSETVLRTRLMARAQSKAQSRLVQEFPDIYRRYYQEAKAELMAEEAQQ